MKKVYMLLLAASLLTVVTSCSYDQDADVTTPDLAPQKVDFFMATESVSISPMSIGRQANSNLTDANINKYRYMVHRKNTSGYYQAYGTEVTVVKPSTGEISEVLSTFLIDGDYRIAIYAYAAIDATNSLTGDLTSSNFSFNNTLKQNYLTPGSVLASERFFATKDVTVVGGKVVPQAGENEFTSKTITLRRIVGRLDIAFTKGFPVGTKSVYVKFDKNAYPNSYMFENLTDGKLDPSAAFNGMELTTLRMDVSKMKEKEFKAGEGKVKYISIYLLGENKPGVGASQYMTLTILADDALNQKLGERKIVGSEANNLAMYRSMVTTLKGNLFGDPKEFNINIEEEAWTGGPDVEI